MYAYAQSSSATHSGATCASIPDPAQLALGIAMFAGMTCLRKMTRIRGLWAFLLQF